VSCRYRNQSELLGVASHFHQLGVQLGVLVIDWQHWRYLGDWSFYLPLCWPDPTAMVKQISSYGTHTMVSAWPRVDTRSVHYPDMARLGYLTTDANGTVFPSQEESTVIYDPFNPAAREYVWQALLAGYVNHGIQVDSRTTYTTPSQHEPSVSSSSLILLSVSASFVSSAQLFWLDAAEPEQSRPGLQWWGGKSDREVGMSWVIHHQRMIFEGSISSGIAEDQLIMLSRHGWIGSPLYNAFIWSGDLESTWDNLIIQVKLAPNVALSGLHWCATDIGGYSNGHWQEANFNELLVRWFQWSPQHALSARTKAEQSRAAAAPAVAHAQLVCC
jgi:alpha-D-xyloside xylohydrolase